MDNGKENYQEFLAGDDMCFVNIIRDYKDGLIFYLNSFVKNIHTAEDLAEDTFVRIITKKPRFYGSASFKTWLYAIGRNIAIDYLKKRRNQPTVSLEDCTELSDDEADLERSYIREERKILVHRALRHLKPEYRQILWLIYFENFSIRDASVLMKKSVHNTETLVYRARLSLKSALEKEGFTHDALQ